MVANNHTSPGMWIANLEILSRLRGQKKTPDFRPGSFHSGEPNHAFFSAKKSVSPSMSSALTCLPRYFSLMCRYISNPVPAGMHGR